MSTITSEFTKERLEEIAEDGFLKHGESKELARIALASLEAEKVTLYRERNPYNGMTTGWQELTEQEYEAALAASKPEWDGEGLPPVGCRVEANYGGEWVEATVAYTDRPDTHGDAAAWKEALVFDCKTTRHFWADEFRPIRSELDKNREEAIEGIASIIDYRKGCSAKPLAKWIFDEIAAGKIPHIRID